MSDELDVTKLEFTSSVFPTEVDRELWASLTPQQQHDRTLFELQEAEKSGVVDPAEVETFFERVKRIRNGGS